MSITIKSIIIDGQPLDSYGHSGIYITNVDWQKLSVSDNSEDRVAQHGRIVSATFARIRTITLEGMLDRLDNSREFDALKYLEGLLSLQGDPSTLTLRQLKIIDTYDRVWNLYVKVSEPIEFVEGAENMPGSHWAWRAVLESTGDPSFFSDLEESVSSDAESAYGGFSIPFTIPFAMDEFSNGITIIPTGNGIIRPRIVITATNNITSPLRVINLRTNESFKLDVNAVAGDVIIIDSISRKCWKNDVDITALRIPGSIFPKVTGGKPTTFVVNDADGGSVISSLSVIFYFRNTMI